MKTLALWVYGTDTNGTDTSGTVYPFLSHPHGAPTTTTIGNHESLFLIFFWRRPATIRACRGHNVFGRKIAHVLPSLG
eukprot:scaffold15224_cov181-Amphora_coffeaeformis.AAC.5